MTRFTAIALSLLGASLAGCAMDAGSSASDLHEAPYRGDSVERLEGRAGIVYERFETANASLEITAIPDLDDPAFWETIELLYFDGVEEHVFVAGVAGDGTIIGRAALDPVADPALSRFLALLDPAIVAQLGGVREHETAAAASQAAPGHAELLWTLYDAIPRGQRDLSRRRVVVEIDDECVERTGSFWECLELVGR